MDIVCTGEANLREAGNSGMAINKQQQFKQIEEQTEKLLEKRMEQTINTAQKKYKTDFLGFGDHVHNSDPVMWKSLKKDWNKNFPKLKYNVKFQITIRYVGLIDDTINAIR